MIVGSAAGRPSGPILLANRGAVEVGDAPTHRAVRIELPKLGAVGSGDAGSGGLKAPHSARWVRAGSIAGEPALSRTGHAAAQTSGLRRLRRQPLPGRLARLSRTGLSGWRGGLRQHDRCAALAGPGQMTRRRTGRRAAIRTHSAAAKSSGPRPAKTYSRYPAVIPPSRIQRGASAICAACLKTP